MASFTGSTDPVVSGLVSQLGSSQTDLGTAQSQLTGDFNAILASLGSPDPSGRAGLLGHLHTSTAMVHEANDELGTVTQTTTSQQGVLSSSQVTLALQAAEFAAGQARIGTLPAFPGVPAGVSVATVYCFHVGG